MILKDYYTQKKGLISMLLNEGVAPNKQISIGLFNDLVFKEKSKVKFPLVMFKYNNIGWNTSSENEYKADVDFSVFVVLKSDFENDYLESFELVKKIDEAVLLHPTQSELIENNEALVSGTTTERLITNSAFKVREGQYTVEDDNWEKNEFFIWEINYKTTLIEKEYKKKYAMVSNGAFVKSDLSTKKKKESVKGNLQKLGYDLDDYYEITQNGKKLLVYKEINEKLTLNSKRI
ncbi:hypothetical protein [Tenacibaculum ovolyticum]|uniref:hypothetical protein n=1 Tax=Tenacibaculum ovolyticum TaxID=104270 RepID=UPI00040145A4|nr:hypothetical protein [Tenacibaculum ovolyticum]